MSGVRLLRPVSRVHLPGLWQLRLFRGLSHHPGPILLREGTRRLAVLLGAVGLVVGGFASYMESQTLMRQRENHKKFQQLATRIGTPDLCGHN